MASMTGISPSDLGVQILQNCLAELLSLFPHLDGALAALGYAPDGTFAGIGTDGEIIRFSPADLLPRYRDDPASVRRGYLHMLLHCLCFHPFTGRRGRQWDLAADMAVGQVLRQMEAPRIAPRPNPVRDACLRLLGGEARSAEELYEMLEQGAFPFPQEELEASFRFDSHALWNREAGKNRESLRKWERLASGAGHSGGGRHGRIAGSAAETLEVPRKGIYDYRRFLRQFTVEREEVLLDTENFDPVLYSFGMERYGNLPLIEPLEYQEVSRLEELVIAIDTSGSCSADTVRQFLAETYAIVSQRENFFQKMRVYLIQCDCLVQSVTVIRSAEEWMESCGSITIQGRGGTDFTPVFRCVEDLRRRKELKDLKALLYFTDGDGVYPRERTDYRTAFVFLRKSDKMNHVPPWAAKLVLEGLSE